MIRFERVRLIKLLLIEWVYEVLTIRIASQPTAVRSLETEKERRIPYAVLFSNLVDFDFADPSKRL